MTQRTLEQTEQTLHRTFETLQVTSWDICCGLCLSCALFEVVTILLLNREKNVRVFNSLIR